ncbi:MAG: hypothetical protein L0332_12085 [Chloroflexi bacterium]|nr:hypothetical protein [Chloroflexota bacterium]MCI0579343.1 hypothetical protein [Chloroflexota bacterium]MCI0646024.1 hypothetical protein [Chloroflexota bacterium]MCI0727446.1 hypothetical protein [Chloroflexota bacterium]
MSNDKPRQIGLLIGREWSWPSAFITEVNRRDEGVVAEFIKLGGTFMDGPCPYAVIIDRMSHEIPYYRTYLKYAALQGVYVVNNPFMASADDKFFGIALSNKLDIRTPRTVALPNKRVETENVPESFRNLVYPMDWQGIIDYVGVPAVLKDIHTGGRRLAHRVHNVDELIRWYDESDTLTLVLQEVIDSDIHVHCFVVGQEKVLLVQYQREENSYLAEKPELDEELSDRLTRAALMVTRAYDYDINMIEFVIHNGRGYLINPTNPAPELDINLLTASHFGWCVNEIATFAIQMALHPRPQFNNADWHKAVVAATTVT